MWLFSSNNKPKEVVVVSAQKDWHVFQGAFTEKDREEKKREWWKKSTITILIEKNITMSKKEMKELFDMQKTNCAAYKEKIKWYLASDLKTSNEEKPAITDTVDKVDEEQVSTDNDNMNKTESIERNEEATVDLIIISASDGKWGEYNSINTVEEFTELAERLKSRNMTITKQVPVKISVKEKEELSKIAKDKNRCKLDHPKHQEYWDKINGYEKNNSIQTTTTE